jgi:sporulation-control protein spo0M
MGVFDKLKNAAQAMTGGAAKVSIAYPQQAVLPGEGMSVQITVMSSGGEMKSQGVFVDLVAQEHVTANESATCPRCQNKFTMPVREAKKTFEQSFPVAPAFVLSSGESRTFAVMLQVPSGAQPTYAGPQSHHEWKIRGRVQSFGNDPDSGFQALRVGAK